jgi:predicted transcriptional regulator
MSTVTIELPLEESLLKEIDDIAAQDGQTRDEVVQQLLKGFLRRRREYFAMIDEGIAQADAGMFVPEEEMKAVFARYGA